MPAGKALLTSPASPRINEQFGLIANPALATIRRITSMSQRQGNNWQLSHLVCLCCYTIKGGNMHLYHLR